MNVRHLTLTAGVLLALASPAFAQTPTITSPAGATKTIVPWQEYGTSVLRDPWDMNRRTDIGWFTWGVDQPTSNLTSKRITTDEFGNTVFSAVPLNADPSIFLLDPASPGKAGIGKLGSLFPIATSTYTRLLVRMRIANEIKPPQFAQIGTVPAMQLYFSRNTIYYDATARPTGGTYLLVDAVGNQVGIPFTSLNAPTSGSLEGGHYVIYSVPIGDIAALQALNGSIAKWKNVNANNPAVDVNWGAGGVTADSFRFKPVNVTGATVGGVDIDWVRLVAPGADAPEPVSWNGGGTYDIVVSTASDCGASNGDYAVLAYSKPSGFQFNPQSLPNGVYYVGLRDPLTSGTDTPASRLIRACSHTTGTNGSYTVLDYPTFDFSAPNPTGSADDFATVFLNNAWDFSSPSDIDAALNVSGFSWATVPAEQRDGTPLGNLPLMFGTSTQAPTLIGDPYFYPLYWTARGFTTRIDANRYRLFSLDVGIDHTRDLLAGSILRIVWHIAGETFRAGDGTTADAMSVSTDILLRHLRKGAQTIDTDSANYQLDRIQADLADRTRLPVEVAVDGSLSQTGWSNTMQQCGGTGCNVQRIEPFDRTGIDEFRIDPHEFPSPTTFFIGQAKLAAHERTGGDFTIAWSSTLAPQPTTGIYADAASWKVRLYAVRTQPASPMTPITSTCTTNLGVDSFQITTTGSEPTLASGTYHWNTNTTAGLINGGLYFICAGLLMPSQPTPTIFSMSQWPVVYAPSAMTTPLPRLYVDHSTILLAQSSVGHTPPQTITVNQIGGTTPVAWIVDVCTPDLCTGTVSGLQLSATTGSGTGSFTLQLVNGQPAPPSAMLRIREASGGSTSNGAVYVQITTQTINPTNTQPPFGQLELPAQNALGVQGALGVGGWALDDVGVTSVKVFRNCLPAFEPAFCSTNLIPGNPAAQVVYIGDAVFLAGARPDVESIFPTVPQANRAGFGMFILSNMLPRTVGTFQPNGGQGPLTIYAVAYDADGHATLLGRVWNGPPVPTQVTLDNDNIAKPFGVIDTPTSGGDSSSAAFMNFGWALTPDDGTGIEIPTNQGINPTMFVFVDGAPIGVVTYNQCRGTVGNPPPPAVYCNDDVANIFGNLTSQPPLTMRTSNPSRYRNLNAGRGAMGSFVLDTTLFANGLHSIAWSVTDNRGRIDGLGSRLFTVTNNVTVSENTLLAGRINPEVGRRVTELAALSPMIDAVGLRLGPAKDGAYRTAPRRDGALQVQAIEQERVELFLPSTPSASGWQGYAVQGGQLRPLSIGASLDPSGRFYWQTVAGFYGGYDLLFIRDNTGAGSETLPVHVTFEPKFKAGPLAAPVTFLSGASSPRERR